MKHKKGLGNKRTTLVVCLDHYVGNYRLLNGWSSIGLGDFEYPGDWNEINVLQAELSEKLCTKNHEGFLLDTRYNQFSKLIESDTGVSNISCIIATLPKTFNNII